MWQVPIVAAAGAPPFKIKSSQIKSNLFVEHILQTLVTVRFTMDYGLNSHKSKPRATDLPLITCSRKHSQARVNVLYYLLKF